MGQGSLGAEESLPPLSQGQRLPVSDARLAEKMTSPPGAAFIIPWCS